jgi:RNA polymerase sigma-70 factor (ECF subfamily)
MEDPRTDEDIAKSVQDGDSEPFGFLVDRYEAKLERYARKFLSDREDVADLIQDVFLKAYANIMSFDTSRRFSPWIYRIAHNEIVNHIRGKVTEDYLPIDLDVVFPHLAAEEQTDTDAYIREMRGLLDHHLGEINPKYREALILYFYEELSYKEIAEILKIPIATVGVRLGRGKALL